MKITKKLGSGFIGALMALCMCLILTGPVQVLAADREVSVGSGKASATNVSYDVSYIAHHTAGDTDYFSFQTPKANGYTELDVKNLSIIDKLGAMNVAAFGIHIYTEADELIYERRLCCNEEAVERIKLESDTKYYIVATSLEDDLKSYDGNFRFELNFFEDKDGDAKDTATALTMKQAKTSSIEKADEDKDWFSFQAGNYDRYQVVVKNLSVDRLIYCNVYSKYDEDMGNCYAFVGEEKYIELADLTPGETYYIQIVGSRGTGNYRLSVKPVTTSIKDEGIITSVKKSVEYNGKAQTPAVSVKFNGISLKKSRDYKLQYSNNKNIGTAAVKVIGIGNYDGTQKLTFKILPKQQDMPTVKSSKKNAVSVKWTSDKAATGYYVQYSKNNNFKSGVRSVAVNKNSTSNITITGLDAKSTYFVRIASYKKVNGKTYVGKYSEAEMVRVK